MTEHTPEPWKTDSCYIVAEVVGGRPGGEVIAQCRRTVAGSGSPAEFDANVRRIVACVNACEGKTIEELEFVAETIAGMKELLLCRIKGEKCR